MQQPVKAVYEPLDRPVKKREGLSSPRIHEFLNHSVCLRATNTTIIRCESVSIQTSYLLSQRLIIDVLLNGVCKHVPLKGQGYVKVLFAPSSTLLAALLAGVIGCAGGAKSRQRTQ